MSMEFDCNKYSSNDGYKLESSVTQNDSYESVLSNIDELIHTNN